MWGLLPTGDSAAFQGWPFSGLAGPQWSEQSEGSRVGAEGPGQDSNFGRPDGWNVALLRGRKGAEVLEPAWSPWGPVGGNCESGEGSPGYQTSDPLPHPPGPQAPVVPATCRWEDLRWEAGLG